MRAILNGVISLGLMNVPVGVATAAKRKESNFRTLHEKCGQPVKQQNFCPTCDSTISTEETVKGFEFAKGSFVQLPSEELDALAAERSKVIRITKFVSFEEVSELAVEKSYYLIPNPSLPLPYSLLSLAMTNREVVGIGHQSLWGKETPCMVWCNENGAMIVSTMFCHDEVVSDGEIVALMGEIPDEQYRLAKELVDLYSGSLDPESDLVSDSQRRTEEYIAAKVSGLDFEIAEPEEVPVPTIDINEVLAASIAKRREEVTA